jgi:hypothetical protein
MKIVTVTDGSETVAVTLQVFLSSLYLHNNFTEVDVVCPKESVKSTEKLITIFKQDVKINVIAISIANIPNRYYAKLMLINYLDVVNLQLNEDIVYLDYDHIFNTPINFNINAPDCVYLSSETDDISSALIMQTDGNEKILPPKHYNTSFIAGKVETLKKSMKNWSKVYSDYEPVISSRYIEEVSFCGAAMSQNIPIAPISPNIQSNWQNHLPTWQMFHYGGEYQKAKKLKEYIPNILGIEISTSSRRKSMKLAEKIKNNLLEEKND